MHRIRVFVFALWILALISLGCTPRVGPETPIPTGVPSEVPGSIPTQVATQASEGPAETAGLATQSPDELETVTVYLIAVGDEGQTGAAVGCGDSLVPVEMRVPPAQEPVQEALEALFSIRQQEYAGFYNALYQSSLQVDRVEVKDQQANVYLTGQMLSGGTCDDPRIFAQLNETVRQASGSVQPEIWINDRPLKDYFSQGP